MRRTRKVGLVLLVPLLFVIALAGLFQSTRAALAYTLYRKAKYGAAADDPVRVLKLSERSHGLYPYNYYLCIHAAETAYHAGLSREDEAERGRLLRSADYWCRRGLQLNPHKRALHLLRSRLLARSSPAEAAEWWAAYVDRHFWEPFNHAMLVEFRAQAGQFDKALESLEWVKGSAHYDRASEALQQAWRREMAPPPVGPGRAASGRDGG